MKAIVAALLVLLAGAVLIGVGMQAIGWTDIVLAGLLGSLWGLVWLCGVSVLEGRRS